MTQTILREQIPGSPLPKPQSQAFLNQSLERNPIRLQESMRHLLPNLSTKKSEMEVIKSRLMPLATKSLRPWRMVPAEYPADPTQQAISGSKAHH